MSTNVLTAPAVPQPQRTREESARERAQAKAFEQARAGNLPTLLRQQFTGDAIRELWSVGSRTQGGTVYLIDLCHDAAGVETLCDCPAEAVCWHRAAVRLAHADALPFHNTQGWRMTPKTPAPAPAPIKLDQAVLTGRRRTA